MRLKRLPAVPAALFLLSVLWQAPGVFRPPGIYDEGLVLVGADRILRGEVPYRDFWNTHTPGQISVVAALFRVFGPSIMVERAYDVLVRAGIAVVVFLLAGRLGLRAGALVAWAAATLFLGQFSNYGYVTFPSLLCALAGLLPLLGGADRRVAGVAARRRTLALAGAGAGCSILFRHDLGLAAVAAGVAVLWVGLAGGRDEPGTLPERVRQRFGATLWYCAGAGALLLPVAILFITLGTPWARVREIFFDYPFLVYPLVRALPAPAALLERLTLALPAAVVVAGLVRVLLGARRAAADRDRRSVMLALALLGVLAFPQAYTRFDIQHQIPVMLPALAILPALLAPPAGSGAGRRALLLLCGAAVLVLTLRTAWAEQVADVRDLRARGTLATTHGLERARLIPLDQSQVDAVKAAQGVGRDGDALYVGLGRHDKAVVNDALFYFLAGRRCATYYHNLLPGLVTTESVQREILADLQRAQANPVVLYTGSDAAQEPNQSRVSSGVELLDRGIRRDYARTRAIGIYELWERRKGRAGDAETDYNPAP